MIKTQEGEKIKTNKPCQILATVAQEPQSLSYAARLAKDWWQWQGRHPCCRWNLMKKNKTVKQKHEMGKNM